MSGSVVIDLLGGHLTRTRRRRWAAPPPSSSASTTASATSSGTSRGCGPSSTRSSTTTVRACARSTSPTSSSSRRRAAARRPTTMYLALQYGLLVANYPLTDDDFPSDGLPSTVAQHVEQVLRAHHDAAAAQPGAPRAASQFDVLEPRPVHPRAAPRRRPLSPQPRAVPQLLDQVRRGDVRRDHAVHAAAQLTFDSIHPSLAHHAHHDQKTHMTNNILWFTEIGMNDVPQVGGKNASLGEMVSNLSGAGRQRPGRIRHDRRRLPRLPRRRRTVRTHPRDRRGARRQRRRRALPASARTCASGSSSSRCRRTLEADIRSAYATPRRERPGARVGVVGGAFQRDGRGPARCVVRRSAGDLPQHQRHRQRPRRDPQRLRVAVQRPRDRLPRAPRLRPPRRRAVGGRPADGAIGCRRLRRAVHRRHRVRVRPCRLHHELVRARRGGRAGRGQPRRVLRLQARAARRASGDPEALGG